MRLWKNARLLSIFPKTFCRAGDGVGLEMSEGGDSDDVYVFFNAEFAVRLPETFAVIIEQLFSRYFSGSTLAALFLIQDESQVFPDHPAPGDGLETSGTGGKLRCDRHSASGEPE